MRRDEAKLSMDFIHCLESGEFQNLLKSDFDFKQFKVSWLIVRRKLIAYRVMYTLG